MDWLLDKKENTGEFVHAVIQNILRLRTQGKCDYHGKKFFGTVLIFFSQNTKLNIDLVQNLRVVPIARSKCAKLRCAKSLIFSSTKWY